MRRLPLLNGSAIILYALFSPVVGFAPENPSAGTGRITGVVLDADTNDPITYARIIVTGTSCVAVTEENGTFTISEVPIGGADLKVFMPGYRFQTVRDVVVDTDKATTVTIILDKMWPEREAKARSVVGTEVFVASDELKCEITPRKERFVVGDRPVFNVNVYNVSRKMFYLVGAIDGSARQARFPHVTLTIEGPDGGFVKPRLMWCGNINQLRLKDFTHIPPWGTFEPISPPYWAPTDATHGRFAKPGRYTVRFRYSSDAIDYADWVGRLNSHAPQSVIETLKKVPRVEIVCSITIEVYESSGIATDEKKH